MIIVLKYSPFFSEILNSAFQIAGKACCRGQAEYVYKNRFNERKISIREKALNKHILLSFALSYALIMMIVIFGAYGDGYTPVDPIYAGFYVLDYQKR